MHIAAVFETILAARAARAALVDAGIPDSRILLLDRGNHGGAPRGPRHLWGALKARLLPEHDAHHYAEAITRGHPLLVADVDDAQRAAAVAAVTAQHPLDLDTHVAAWRQAGWDGVYAGQAEWEAETRTDAGPAGSDAIVGGDLISGDYGAVGAPLEGAVNTDITRGTVRLYG
jgi:hypothetical protein